MGAKVSTTRDEDFIEHIYVANMHSTMLFFTAKGKCFWLKVYEIPEGAKSSKGRALQNVINIEPDDKICAYINVRSLKDEDYINNNYIILGTKRGTIKKTSLEAYSRPRANGINAITIREGDELHGAVLTNGSCEILLAGKKGRCVRFDEKDARAIEVVGLVCVDPASEDMSSKTILAVSENGYGKRSVLEDYRKTNRGGKGVKTINITEKTGALIALKEVSEDDDLMIINRSGITIRLSVSAIRVAGRSTQGVRLINIREGDGIAAVCTVDNKDTDGTGTAEDKE